MFLIMCYMYICRVLHGTTWYYMVHGTSVMNKTNRTYTRVCHIGAVDISSRSTCLLVGF